MSRFLLRRRSYTTTTHDADRNGRNSLKKGNQRGTICKEQAKDQIDPACHMYNSGVYYASKGDVNARRRLNEGATLNGTNTLAGILVWIVRPTDGSAAGTRSR